MIRKYRSMLCRLFALALAGSTAAAAADNPLLVIDATADPGIRLAATFVPSKPITDGVRRVAGMQTVTTSAVILLSERLPVKGYVSVLKRGDLAPNQIDFAFESNDVSELRFPIVDDIIVIYRAGQWIIPAYDLSKYDMEVGIGLGADIVFPAYTVRCRPNETIAMTPGSYQWIQLDGRRLGDAIPADQDGWLVPVGARTSLVLDQTGQATLRTIP